MSVHWDETGWFCPYCGQNNYWKSDGDIVCMNCRRVVLDSCLKISNPGGNARLLVEFVVYRDEQVDNISFIDVRDKDEQRPQDLSRVTDAVRWYGA